jgi:hypothetical protein
MRSLVTGVLLSVAVVTTAKADILAAGAIFGSPAQFTGVCYLFNGGGTTVSVSSIAIYDEVGNAYISLSNNCSSLAAHKTCRTVSRIFDGNAYSCRALVANKTNIRGSLELRDSGGNVLTNMELR